MNQEIDLKDLFSIVWKRKLWLVLTIVLGVAASGIISAFVMSPVYQATTKIIVNKADEYGAGQMSLNDLNFNLRLIETYQEIIKTPAIMKVVEEDHPELGLTVDELIKKINISTVNNSQVMTLTARDPSYSQAAGIVNAVSEVFQREIPGIMNVDNVSILSTADVEATPSPVSPNVKLNMAIAAVVALMLAIGVIFLIEYLDDTIKTEQDVLDVLDLPTLAVVTKVRDEDVKVADVDQAAKAGEAVHATVNQ